MPKVRGYIPKRIPPKTPIQILEENAQKSTELIQDLSIFKDEIEQKSQEIIENTELVAETIKEEALAVIENTKLEAIEAIKEIKKGDVGEKGEQGEKGESAEEVDTDEIVEKVLEKIEVRDGKDADEEKILEKLSALIPEPIDENKLLAKLLKKIPAKKGDLKIITESVEIDPMSVIEKIMALPEEYRKKLKLSTDNISGLDQTIRAFQSQLGKGYLHGGGISNITGLIQAGTNISIAGAGTSTSPYIISSTALASISIGDPIVLGSPNLVLFADNSTELAQEPEFYYSSARGLELGRNGEFIDGPYGGTASSASLKLSASEDGDTGGTHEPVITFTDSSGIQVCRILGDSRTGYNGDIFLPQEAGTLALISDIPVVVQTEQWEAPTSGSTVTIANPFTAKKTVLTLIPAGTLSTLTISFTNIPLNNGQTVTMSTTQELTAITWSGGTFIGAPTTLGAQAFCSFAYSSGDSKWHRIG